MDRISGPFYFAFLAFRDDQGYLLDSDEELSKKYILKEFYIKTIQCLKDNKQVILSNGHMRVGSGILKITQCSLMWLQRLIGLNIPSNS